MMEEHKVTRPTQRSSEPMPSFATVTNAGEVILIVRDLLRLKLRSQLVSGMRRRESSGLTASAPEPDIGAYSYVLATLRSVTLLRAFQGFASRDPRTDR